MDAESLLSLAASVSSEHRTERVLAAIVKGLAAQAELALARIWLLAPGDLCGSCHFRAECPGNIDCFHLAASAGKALSGEEWTSLSGQFRRIPPNRRKVGVVGASGESILIADLAPSSDWIARPEWAGREGIRSFVGHPLVHRGETLGVLALFRRQESSAQDSRWLRIFADQAAVAIANARAFGDLERAEEKLESELRLLQQTIDVIPMHMYIEEPAAGSVFVNRAAKEFSGEIHPDDAKGLDEAFAEARRTETAAAVEARMRGPDGEYRWFLHQLFPLKEEGRVARWCGTRIDIDERKRAEERAERENLVLREEIDRVSMFGEIVGGSAALKATLARAAKVAASDSTVLITGETGTGKELIARAIHRLSPRAARAFVSVNCAAIPKELIASELFGHEKGAFTGAVSRRIGRFELAEGGTIFLDEIGEIPMETQVALMRVLQEREFDRVGGGRPIRADVRVIAATNRDLKAAVEAGAFRSDLYYRINVFPIGVPALRERREDIRQLAEYFIARYAAKAGRKIRRFDEKSMAQLERYPWPGNVRELQNVIERSVILCEAEVFSLDESWLMHEARPARPLADDVAARERERIEAALAESRGRVSGPAGAAAKLGMPASTLDSKIKSLGIDKRRFQTA